MSIYMMHKCFIHINPHDVCHLFKLIHVTRKEIQITCYLFILDSNMHFDNNNYNSTYKNNYTH